MAYPWQPGTATDIEVHMADSADLIEHHCPACGSYWEDTEENPDCPKCYGDGLESENV